MKQDMKQTREDYLHAAEGWGADRHAELTRSRRTAWIVASVAAAIALVEALALVFLTPLKTVQPYTLLVDRHTGFVQALDPLQPARVTSDTALTQSFLVQYVIARENYDVDAVQNDYRKVALWSADKARTDYLALMQADNPASPLARYPRTTTVETQVKSISPISASVALIRFDTRRRDATGEWQPAQSWVSTVKYRYSGEPMKQEDRVFNPLGFQVVSYRRDAEMLPPPAPADARPASSASEAPGQAGAAAATLPQPGAQPDGRRRGDVVKVMPDGTQVTL
jgi:type IV secretion system protein VirB8